MTVEEARKMIEDELKPHVHDLGMTPIDEAVKLLLDDHELLRCALEAHREALGGLLNYIEPICSATPEDPCDKGWHNDQIAAIAAAEAALKGDK